MAKSKWHESDITSYSYKLIVATLDKEDSCEPPRGGFDVVVINGETVCFGACSPSSDAAERLGSIDAIFETIKEIKSEGVPGLEVSFNEDYGFPDNVDVNHSRLYTDHRVQYRVRDFGVQQ